MSKRYLLIVLTLALLGFGCQLATAVTTPTAAPAPTATPLILVATPTPLSDDVLAPLDVEEQLITNLYERVGPSVVHVTARVVTMNFFFGPQSSEGTGSGFVYDTEGHIITNNHVVENAESLEVTFSDDTSLPAEVVGIDPANDLAVLKVDLPPEHLFPISLGSSAEVRVGQRAIAIGNPFGLDRTLTTGVVSALGRPLQTDTDSYIYEVIQTDAAINPGNSGGPLLNSRGDLIGVNTAIQQGAEGIGFAIPVDTVKRVVPALIEQGFYPHPWLGFLGYSITPELADVADLPVEQGILIAQLYRGSPAEAVGVQGATQQSIVGNRRIYLGGDVLTAVNNTPITDWNSLQQYLELNTQVGDVVTLTLLRDGRSLELSITLAAQPQ
ncbi:MAG: trypsin-like peptidase domain-containing protein [Ardenticatenaceae bacterium]|nr:trypsin-like peptidase domain-containing protein [Anaerolineales bacterium]MCB8921796.1 trypsin-like peptidase domain-containing protein [Ardenticatenaceae bacterium]